MINDGGSAVLRLHNELLCSSDHWSRTASLWCDYAPHIVMAGGEEAAIFMRIFMRFRMP